MRETCVDLKSQGNYTLFRETFARLKLVLRVEKKLYVIEQPLPPAPKPVAEPEIVAQWTALYDAHTEIACLMRGCMTPELHRQFELHYPYDMIQELRSMFEKQAGVEKFDLIQSFHACKQKEGKPVVDYVLKMKGYVEKLECLGYVLPQDITVGLILNGLTKDFVGFVMMIKGGKIQKANKKSLNAKGQNKVKGKGKDKKDYIPKPKNLKLTAMERPAKDDACHHCKEVGHWKRNCLVYLVKLIKKKKQVGTASSSDLKQVEAVLPNGLVICLDNCHYAPTITRGVVSVSRLVDNGFVQCFKDFGFSVSKNNVFYFNAIPSNGIYEIDMHDLVPNINSIYNVSTKRAKHNLDSTYLWHCHLAHISKKRIEKLQHQGLLKSTDDESFDQCVSYLSGKMTRKSFPHRPERANDHLGIIHTDVCGPLRYVSRQGASYFITFTDDYSRYGSEYISQEFKDYLKACGIVQQLTPPYTQQHNGVSEKRNRTLLDIVRSMMNPTTLPLSFWDYALESATRILNMVSTKKVDKTPYEQWYGKVPNLSYLKVWGCKALEKRYTPDKLEQRSVKCIFIGYPKETMGYYFYFPPENKIVVARYAEFFKKNLITQEVGGRARDLKEILDEDTSPSEITSEIRMEVEGFELPHEEDIPIRRSERTRRAPNHLSLNVEVEEHSLGDLNEPTSYKAAIKWIFKKKTNMDGIVHNYKARLVAKGYTQLYRVDYEETFSPAADIRAIMILISIAAYYDYEMWQMDIKTAFLNGYLDEDIYMVQPKGFVDPNHPRKVCKLQRSIYGLKQASRS
ncbi:retrotransposon protein, putative, ty1-copia subclass [Tanacetum coccineum]